MPVAYKRILYILTSVMNKVRGLHQEHVSPVSMQQLNIRKKKLHCLSPRANYTDPATAACQRSDCQLFRIEGATWSA
jgi:hypothetical protein